MESTTQLFWFSGTGNSLHAAQTLAKGLPKASLVQITNVKPTGCVGGKNARIGFVFPSYYGNLPRVVRRFIQELQIVPNTYIFAIVTMGLLGQGSITALNKALKEKGLVLHYGRSIRTGRNYIMKYNPADASKWAKKLPKIQERLQKFSADITAQVHSVKGFPLTTNNLYRNVSNLDHAFTVEDTCTSCGLCKKICPVENIQLTAGRPKWQHHCEHCTACINWCPVKAINYGKKTASRRRYHHPLVKAKELFSRRLIK